ncbi:MAG: DUF2505 family protein [Nitrososphaerales archaeon]
MEFRATHRFSAPPDAVARVLADPHFYEQLKLPNLALLDAASRAEGDVVLHYEFKGSLDPLARRLLGGERLTWTQEVHLDGAAGGSLEFRAEANPRLLHGGASFALEVGAEGGTFRRLYGELVVAVPGFGGMAERRIVPGILSRLDVEAAALQQQLA